MKKPYRPEIRVISVDHGRTTLAEQRLRRALDRNGMRDCPVRSVFCHLEAGRCGVPAGLVAIEADGMLIWKGKELTEALAEQFCAGLPRFIDRQKQELGMA